MFVGSLNIRTAEADADEDWNHQRIATNAVCTPSSAGSGSVGSSVGPPVGGCAVAPPVHAKSLTYHCTILKTLQHHNVISSQWDSSSTRRQEMLVTIEQTVGAPSLSASEPPSAGFSTVVQIPSTHVVTVVTHSPFVHVVSSVTPSDPPVCVVLAVASPLAPGPDVVTSAMCILSYDATLMHGSQGKSTLLTTQNNTDSHQLVGEGVLVVVSVVPSPELLEEADADEDELNEVCSLGSMTTGISGVTWGCRTGLDTTITAASYKQNGEW